MAATACFLMSQSPKACAGDDEDLLEIIKEVTLKIEKTPNKPELYLQRGQTHRLNHSWDDALADLEHAGTLSNQWQILHFERAEVFFDAAWYKSAKASADRFLALQPNHSDALLLRARARTKLGDRLGAVQDYTRAIATASKLNPEMYLERAQALTAEGSEHYPEALRGLEQGMSKLGPLVTLQLAAIDVEVKQNHVDAALSRIDKTMAQAPRKESWLLRRAEIQQKAGRPQAAAESYKAALAALDTLPPERRNVPATAELEQRIRAGLSGIEK